MAQAFYKEQAIIEIFTEANLGSARAATTALGDIYSQVGLDQIQEAIKGEKLLEQQNKQTMGRMSGRFKAIEQETQDAKSNALAAQQKVINQNKEMSKPGGVYGQQKITKEAGFARNQKRDLEAAKHNMEEYAKAMENINIDVGGGRKGEQTISDNIAKTMGGELADREQGIVQMGLMEQRRTKTIKQLKGQLDLETKALRVHTKRHKKLVEEATVIKGKRDAIKKGTVAWKKQNDLHKSIVGKVSWQSRLINKVTKGVYDTNEALGYEQERLRNITEEKELALSVDKEQRIHEKQEGQQKAIAKREAREETAEQQKSQRALAGWQRLRNRLAKEYNISLQSMADKFKTTLVGALAISTGAVTAFYYKLDVVIDTFKEFEKELINAQSIFQTNQETLFSLSDEVVKFGTKYGIEMNKASEGLYQLASAGLSADESMMVLNNTLKLSMAVQGDHNSLSKLTVQTIYGFGLQMSDSAELTDKFAHAINKSLIEWDDLASSVKFALPFFITTGQSVDQLLGSLEILTNRALEAGIAGRGLRQALAMFAKHAEDNEAAFRKMGVEILDTEGNFKKLTEIAMEFKNKMGPMVNDTELLTKLLEDLNVRGATAFIHLVQNADEFTAAVDDLKNSAGSATKMADIQQTSLANQIQRVKNALRAPFLLADEVGKAQGYMNAFSLELHRVVTVFEDLFVIIEDGVVKGLTPLGEHIRDFVIVALREFAKIAMEVKVLFLDMTENGRSFGQLLGMITVPLRVMISLMKTLTPIILETVILFKVMNGIMPINNMLIAMRTALLDKEVVAEMNSVFAKFSAKDAVNQLSFSYEKLFLSQLGVTAVMFTMLYVTRAIGTDSWAAAAAIGAVAGAVMGLALALQYYRIAKESFHPAIAVGLFAASTLIFAGANAAMQKMMAPPKIDYPTSEGFTNEFDGMAMGGAVYGYQSRKKGGPVRPYLVGEEGPELFVPNQSGNIVPNDEMGGITLNIHGDIYDSDKFVEKVAAALPYTMRNINDAGDY